MPSLRQLATELVDSYGISPDNPGYHATYERAKDVIKEARALRIKQDITKNGISEHYQQSYFTELVKVDVADNCEWIVGCSIRRSENKIPRPIAYKSDVPFLSVGNFVDPKSKGIEMTFCHRDQLRFYVVRFPGNIYYSWINDYIYVYDPKFKYAIIRGIYEDPTLVPAGCDETGICYDDNMEFPLPLDMVGDVKTILRSTDFFANINVKEILIDAQKSN